MAQRLEVLRDPLTLRAALQQNPHPRTRGDQPGQLVARRVNPSVEHHRLVLIENPNQAASQMQINGTIFHGWLLLAP